MKKANIFKTLAVAALFLFSGFTANAQFEFSLYFVGGLPTGDLNTKVPQDANGVYGNYMGMLGKSYVMNESTALLGAGFRFGYHIGINNSEYGEIAPFVEFAGLWNRPKSGIRDQFDIAQNDYPHYINIPIYIGAQYRYPVTDIIKPFAEFGIGYDLLFITSEYGKDPSGLIKRDDYQYSTSGSFSWQLGLGCYFSNYVSVGLYYYGLGSHKIDYKNFKVDELTGIINNDGDGTHIYNRLALNEDLNTNAIRKYGMFALRLNFHFGASK